jgi:FixJ family two-component response regulator
MNADGALIHVVDDDDSFRTAVARLLRAAGFGLHQSRATRGTGSDSSSAKFRCSVQSASLPSRLWRHLGPGPRI